MHTIDRSIRARKPKTRYAAAKYSGTLLFMRNRLSDRMFDKVTMSMIEA